MLQCLLGFKPATSLLAMDALPDAQRTGRGCRAKHTKEQTGRGAERTMVREAPQNLDGDEGRRRLSSLGKQTG